MAEAADDIRAGFEKQIAELKDEMARMGRSLAARASEQAEDAYGMARARAGKAARQVRRQAHHAAEIARENPVTTATALTAVGVVAFAAGLILGGLFAGDDDR